MIRIDIPVNVPPHNCIHLKRARVTNPAAMAWRKAFREEFSLRLPAKLRRARIEGTVAVRFFIWRCGPVDADGDNLQKELFDAITEAQVWIDDSQVKDWHGTLVAQGPKVKPRVVVEIQPVDVDALALVAETFAKGAA